MRLHIFHEATVAPGAGKTLIPSKAPVAIQLSAYGDGAVNATATIKGRVDASSLFVALASEITISGTAAENTPVTDIVNVTQLVNEMIVDLTVISATSFRAVGAEEPR